MKKLMTKSVLSICFRSKRMVALVGVLMMFAAVQADIVTLRYVVNNTTYFLANDLTRVETIGLNCLWDMTAEDIKDIYENPVQQYTLKPLNGTEYVVVDADRKLALGGTEDTKALFTITDGKITYLNEYVLAYSAADGWHFNTAINSAPVFRVTTFVPTPYEYAVTYTAEDSDDPTPPSVVTQVEWPYTNQDGTMIVHVMLTRVRGSQYVSLDKRETLGAGASIEWVPAADITAPTFTVTGDNKVTLGDVYVEEGANDFQLPLTPTNDSPFGTTDAAGNHSGITNADGNYVPWTDVLHITLTHEGVAHKADVPLVRHTFHTEDFREVTDFEWTAPKNMGWQEGLSQELTLSGKLTEGYHILNHAGAEVDVDQTTTTTMAIDLTNPAYKLTLSDDWLSVAKANNKATVTTASANQTGNRRTIVLSAVYTYKSHGADQEAIARVNITQKHQYDNGQFLTHSKGKSDSPLDERGNQQVHEEHTYIYYINGEIYTLIPREKDFRGWHRWYDYDTQEDVGVATDNNPNGYKSHYITDDGIIVYVDSEGVKSEEDQGRYVSSRSSGVGTVTVTFNDGKEHNIAMEVSNYSDGEPDDVNNLLEPTLSYRQIFHLIPAAKRAEELKNYTSATGKYLEDYNLIAPTGTNIYLSPQYDYRDRTSVNNSDLGYVVENATGFQHIKEVSWSGNPSENGKLRIVSSEGVDTVVYTMTAAVNGVTYNLCRFNVMFQNVAHVGPLVDGIEGFERATIEKDYLLLGEVNFDYDKPGVSTYKAYPKPLPWDESTYGYTYYDGERVSGKTDNSGLDTKYGEYQLLNIIPSDPFWLANNVKQHTGDADEGYMVFADGTERPGLVARLRVEANLCAGQKMYCSAWVNNPNVGGVEGGRGLPILRFVVEGLSKEDTWEAVSEYSTGQLSHNDAAWQQICFEIDLKKEYPEYRVSVYDFATTNNGNDFAIDDICIFASKIPLVAYQASTACSNDEDVAAIVKMDYRALIDTTMEGDLVYYSVYQQNKTTHELTPMKLHYIDASSTSKGNYAPQNPKAELDTCGCFRIPAKDTDPNTQGYAIAPTLFELMEDARADTTNKAQMRYVDEGEGSGPYALYIVHYAPLHEEYDYFVHIATDKENLRSAECSNRTHLPVSDAFKLMLNYEVKEDKTQAVCGNIDYTMAMHLQKQETTSDDVTKMTYGRCKSDWILGGDTTYVVRIMGRWTYPQVRTMLMNLRDNAADNTNRFAASIDDITANKYLPQEQYDAIELLVNNGYLLLAQEEINVYVAKNEEVKYLVVPIEGTGYEVIKMVISCMKMEYLKRCLCALLQRLSYLLLWVRQIML